MCHSEWKKKFSFVPDDIIDTPREFTDALLKYAEIHKEDIIITKEGMKPQFVLNGVEYSATRIHGSFGSKIYCEMIHPELAEPENITGGKKKVFQMIARYISAIVFFLLQLFLFITDEISLRTSIVLSIVMVIVVLLFWYPYRGNKDY